MNTEKYILPPNEFIEELKKRGVTESSMRYYGEKWFEDFYVSRKNDVFENIKNNKPFEVGKIYAFEYSNPKYKEEMKFYNAYPIMLCIGNKKMDNGKYNPMGINLTFMPPKIRLQFLTLIWNKFGTSIIKPNIKKLDEGKENLHNIPVFYDVAKKIAKNLGWEFAIRSYIITRIGTEPLIITYTDWWKLTTFTSKYIKKLDSRAIYYLYKRNIDDSYRLGTKNNDIKVQSMSIKSIKEYMKNRNQDNE